VKAVAAWVHRQRLYEDGPRAPGEMAAQFLHALQTLNSNMDSSGYTYTGMRGWHLKSRNTPKKLRKHRDQAIATGWLFAWQYLPSGAITTQLERGRRTHYQATVPDLVFATLSSKDMEHTRKVHAGRSCPIDIAALTASQESSIEQLEALLGARSADVQVCPSEGHTSRPSSVSLRGTHLREQLSPASVSLGPVLGSKKGGKCVHLRATDLVREIQNSDQTRAPARETPTPDDLNKSPPNGANPEAEKPATTRPYDVKTAWQQVVNTSKRWREEGCGTGDALIDRAVSLISTWHNIAMAHEKTQLPAIERHFGEKYQQLCEREREARP
jgi:hypothetical protein